MPKTLHDLKAKNRAWAAGKVSADPGFFKRLEGQQAPEYLWIGGDLAGRPADVVLLQVVEGHRGLASGWLFGWAATKAGCSA